MASIDLELASEDLKMMICGDDYVFYNSSAILVCDKSKQYQWHYPVNGLHCVCVTRRPDLTVVYGCEQGVYVCVLNDSLALCEKYQVIEHVVKFQQIRWDKELSLVSYSTKHVVVTSLQTSSIEETAYESSRILCVELTAKHLVVLEVNTAGELVLVRLNRYYVKGRFIEDAHLLLMDFDDSTNSPVFMHLSEDGVYILVLAMHRLWLVISHGCAMSLIGMGDAPLDNILSVDFDYYLRGIITTSTSIFRISSFLTFSSPIRSSVVNGGRATYSLPLQVIKRLFHRPRSILSASSLALCMFHGDYHTIAGILHKLSPVLHEEVLRVQEEARWSGDSHSLIQSSLSDLFHWSLQDNAISVKEDHESVASCCHDLKSLHFKDVEEEEIDLICCVFHIYQTILQIKQTLDIDSHGLQFLLAIQVFTFIDI